MDAGLVAFKLCDRSLDCEHCPFDAAMHGDDRGGGASARDTRPRTPWRFPEDRRYGPAHVWIRPASGGRVRLGIDALGALLLRPVLRVELPAAGALLARGGLAAVVESAGGPLVLRSPLAGRVTAPNDLLIEHPTRLEWAPYDDAWLVEVQPLRRSAELQAAGNLLGGAEMARQALLDLRRYKRRVAMSLLVAEPNVGPTMQDGGEPLTDLQGLVGPELHREIVQEILT